MGHQRDLNEHKGAMWNQIHWALEPSMMKIHQSGIHIDLAAVWAVSANNETPTMCLQLNQQALWCPSSAQMPATQLKVAISQKQCLSLDCSISKRMDSKIAMVNKTMKDHQIINTQNTCSQTCEVLAAPDPSTSHTKINHCQKFNKSKPRNNKNIGN